jgi:hypothetical protein
MNNRDTAALGVAVLVTLACPGHSYAQSTGTASVAAPPAALVLRPGDVVAAVGLQFLYGFFTDMHQYKILFGVAAAMQRLCSHGPTAGHTDGDVPASYDFGVRVQRTGQ